ncbi:MAG: SDR family oxidoreductase, partial [Planctomycetes bacterium]|nr:SDR family oxidoreductase [Planctomycetota bacterium]
RSSKEHASALDDELAGRLHRADRLDPAAARGLVRGIEAADGRLDHLVHAVGEYVSGPLHASCPEDLRRMFASNVETAFHVFDAARPLLRAARGDAVFFGCAGLDTLRARRATALYTAAKSALFVLVRSWALEEAAHGVRVNLVSPGVVPHAHAAADTLDEGRIAGIPLGRAGTPEDVASAVEFLASPRAAHVTGVDLAVAGGWLL